MLKTNEAPPNVLLTIFMRMRVRSIPLWTTTDYKHLVNSINCRSTSSPCTILDKELTFGFAVLSHFFFCANFFLSVALTYAECTIC